MVTIQRIGMQWHRRRQDFPDQGRLLSLKHLPDKHLLSFGKLGSDGNGLNGG
jgi:hypothetical protein